MASVVNTGDAKKAISGSKKVGKLLCPFVATAMEPMNCTASVTMTGAMWLLATSAHRCASTSGLLRRSCKYHLLGCGLGRRSSRISLVKASRFQRRFETGQLMDKKKTSSTITSVPQDHRIEAGLDAQEVDWMVS
jgi:hypothetical protein